MKQAPTSEVMRAIREVLAHDLYLSDRMRTRMVRQHLHGGAPEKGAEIDRLSDRELEVFELLGKGHGTRRIATKLHLSVSTVETHRAHIKDKLKLTDAMDLVHRAVEWVNAEKK
jgi:DNA-binding NarL/FixJ family response regulator